MDDRITISLEIDAADYAALGNIAQQSHRSLDEVAASALVLGIAEQSDWENAIQQGVADAVAGRTISNEEYKAEAVERRRRWLAEHPR